MGSAKDAKDGRSSEEHKTASGEGSPDASTTTAPEVAKDEFVLFPSNRDLILPRSAAYLLEETIENYDLLKTSKRFIKKLESEPGGSLAFLLQQCDSMLIVNHELQLMFYEILILSKDPLVKANCVEWLAVLARIAHITTGERIYLQKALLDVPPPPATGIVVATVGHKLPNKDQWEAEYGETPVRSS